MATVLLTAGVGALGIANPVLGAAALAGAGLVGGVVDQQLLRALGPAQKVEGPRLGDTPQPTAQYGVPIARLGGLARVTCPLIWIADQGGPGGLREQRRQQTTDGVKRIWYEYYGTWGVLLGRGPIAGIRRLWLNGQLVYDADVHATPETLEANAALAAKLTLHRGSETQARDPLIEQFQGTDATPAYRGWAYLVFDDLLLSDTYGNRIPEVQAEVAFEGAGGLAAGTDTITTGPSPLHGLVWRILAETGIDPALVDLTQLSDKVRGYATASVTAARELIEPLQLAYGWDWVEADGRLVAMKHPAPLRRPEHRTNTLISEHGLIVNAYHEEQGREGYFHSASGTSEGQMLAIAGFLHAEARLLASDPASAAAYRTAADTLAEALEPVLYRRSVPADPATLFVPHWLFAAKRAIQLRSTRLAQRADFVPGGADAALSATGVAWGALDGDPALAFSGGFVGTARLDPWDYSADSLFTIELKLVADTSSGGEDRTLLQRLNAAGETQWRLYRIGAGLGFEARVAGALEDLTSNPSADLTTPRWLSVVVRATNDPAARFFLDGVAVSGFTQLGADGGLDATPGIYSVGLAAGDRAGTPAFLGTVSEIRLWAGARDSALMGAATPDPLGEADLRRLWRLDEGAGETAADAVPLGLIATLPPGPGAYGERVVQVFQVYAADGSRLLWENPYSVVVGTPETLVSWQAMADEAGTEVTIAGAEAKTAVIVSALDVGPWLEAGQPYEAWPVWRALEPGELDCAADTLYWALKAYERLFAAGGEAKWNDALAATKASIVETFKVDDGREIFAPQPVGDAFSLPGTFEASQRPGVGPANWTRDPGTGVITGTIPAETGSTVQEAQIGRGFEFELKSRANIMSVGAGTDLPTDQVWVFLDTAPAYGAATRYYAQVTFAGDGLDLEGFSVPLWQFHRKDDGASPGAGGADALLTGSWTRPTIGDGYRPALGLSAAAPGNASVASINFTMPALTLEAQIHVGAAAQTGVIVEKRLSTNNKRHAVLRLEGGVVKADVVDQDGGTVLTLTDPGGALDLTQPHWIALVAERDVTPGARLYVDGVEVASGGQFTVDFAGAGPVTFGQNNAGGEQYDGKLADIRLWGTARSPAQLGDGTADPAGTAGILHVWPCYEIFRNILYDGVAAGGAGTLYSDVTFPVTIYAGGFQDLEPDGHRLNILRLRPNPPTPLPYTPWATPFTVNTRGGQVISWRGLPGSGYQAPELWRLVGGAEGPLGAEAQCRFLKDAQDAWQADVGARGPFAHVYVWDRPDKAELGDPAPGTWIYTWHDPNSKWGGYQYRPLEATARFIKESEGDPAYDAARALGDQVVEDFMLWLDGAWPIVGNPVQGPPTDFPGPLPGGAGAPQINYDEPHFAALILRAGVWARLRGYTPALNDAAVSQVQKAWAYLESLYVSSGPMAGTWSPDPAGETWYGFWHAEIVDALATLIAPGLEGGNVRVEAGIDPEAVKARLAGAAAWVAANTRSVTEIALDDLGAYEASGEAPPPYTYTRQQESEFPRETAVTTLDPELAEADNRSYARRLTTSARAVAEHRLPLVMTTPERERLARRLLYAAWARRHRYATSLARDHLGLTPGDVVVLPVHGTTRRVQVERLDYDPAGLLRLEGFLDDPEVWRDTAVGTAAAPPRAQLVTSPVDTTLDLLDLPILDAADGDGAAVTAALTAGDPARWRGASLHRSLDGGAAYSQVGAAAVMAAAGSVAATLPAGPLWRFDRGTAVTVTLVAGTLESRSEAQLIADPLANLCVIGDEVLQFATASLVAPKTYQLSTLLRGLRGTEWAVGQHGPGEGFWLADFALLRVPLTTAQLGLTLTYKAPTDGQSLAEAAAVAHANSGRALMPRAPAHLSGHRDPNSGDWSIQWMRRTRLGGGFALASPAPLGEESEAYDAEVLAGPGGAVRRTIPGLTSPAFTYTAAQQTADFGSLQTALAVKVYQVSAVVGRGFEKEETFG